MLQSRVFIIKQKKYFFKLFSWIFSWQQDNRAKNSAIFCHSYFQGRFSKRFWTSLIHWRSSIFFEDRKINNRFLTTIKNSRGGTLKSSKAPMQHIQAGWQILENAKQYLPYIRTYGWKILYWWYKDSTFLSQRV